MLINRWFHQETAMKFAYRKPGVMLAMDMGTGKTKVAIDLLLERKCQRVLVVCPKSVQAVWPKELIKHAENSFTVTKLKGSTVTKSSQLKTVELWPNSQIIIVNYDSFWRNPLSKVISEFGFDAVVFDESHKIKAYNGKAAKFAMFLASRTPNKLLLTGTPTPHDPLDIWSQAFCIDPNVFGRNYWSFRKKYCYFGKTEDGREFVRGFYPSMLQDFEARLGTIAFRADKSVLDLPETTEQVIPVDLPSKIRKQYTELEGIFDKEVDNIAAAFGEKPKVQNILVQLLRLQQMCSGFLDNELLHTAKIDALVDILDNFKPTEPIVIFTKFKREVTAIREALLGKMTGRITSELTGDKNELEDWQSGETSVLIVNIKSGGVGIDLTRSKYAFYYSHDWNLGDYEQSKARIHRPGQEHPVHYYHLIVNNSIEQKIFSALSERKDFIAGIMDGVKSRNKELVS